MKKSHQKKLELSRETLRRIDAEEMRRAGGGCTSTMGPPCEDEGQLGGFDADR